VIKWHCANGEERRILLCNWYKLYLQPNLCLFLYLSARVFVCVCVCVCERERERAWQLTDYWGTCSCETHTHTHTHTQWRKTKNDYRKEWRSGGGTCAPGAFKSVCGTDMIYLYSAGTQSLSIPQCIYAPQHPTMHLCTSQLWPWCSPKSSDQIFTLHTNTHTHADYWTYALQYHNLENKHFYAEPLGDMVVVEKDEKKIIWQCFCDLLQCFPKKLCVCSQNFCVLC